MSTAATNPDGESVQPAGERPFISVVIPVKNGEGRLEHCLASLQKQDYPAARFEVIVADGRSTDRTVEIARSFGAHVVQNARQIVASGRNVGIEAARGQLIAFTDDDCVLPPSWLSAGARCLLDSGYDGIGGPTPLPDSASDLSKAINLIFQLASSAGVSVQSDRLAIQECADLPGGNAIYPREVLAAVAPIDESLLTAEDVDMHIRMRQCGFRLGMAAEFFAYHHKRDTLRGFFRQMKRFAIGRVQLGRKHPDAIKSLHWALALAGIAGAGVASTLLLLGGPLLLSGVAAGACLLAALAALCAGEGPRVAIYFGPAAMTFISGWSWAFVQEALFPLADTTGR